MTVNELIKHLQELPPAIGDRIVVMRDENGYFSLLSSLWFDYDGERLILESFQDYDLPGPCNGDFDE